MIRPCAECGTAFEAKGTWQRRCWSCWRTEKDRQQREAAYHAGYQDEYTAGREHANHALSADTLREAIALTHLDRHPPERSELANRVTRELLALRTTTRPA